jgi:hypothetical protein
MAAREICRDFEPFPTLDPDRLGITSELFRDQSIKQCYIRQSAAVVLLREIAQ